MRKLLAMNALAALAMTGALDVASPAIDLEPSAGPAEPTIRTRHKPSGSQPVPGGGARERARRLARMSKQQS